MTYIKKISTLGGLVKEYPILCVRGSGVFFKDISLSNECLSISSKPHVFDQLIITDHTLEWSLTLYTNVRGGYFEYHFKRNAEFFYPYFELGIEVRNNTMDMPGIFRTWTINNIISNA